MTTSPISRLAIASLAGVAVLSLFLLGFIALDTDQPVPGAQVSLDGGSVLHTFRATTGADGRFTFESVPEGDYLFVLSYSELRKLTTSVHRPSFYLTVDHMKEVMVGRKRQHFPIQIKASWEGFTISVPAGGAKVTGRITSDQPCSAPPKE